MRGVHVSKPRAGGAAFKKCQCSARAFHQRGLLRKEEYGRAARGLRDLRRPGSRL